MKTRRITINQIPLQFYLWGSPKKPLLFLLHGWLDTGASFHFLVEHLQDRFYCVAPDMRGYGKSGHTKNPLGYFFYEYIADLHDILRKFSPDAPVRLLGHSLGGVIATIYAGIFPERVSHLMNVEGFQIPERKPEEGPPLARRWLEAMGRERFRVFPDLRDFAERLRESNAALPPERARFLAKHLAKKVRGGWMMAADPRHKWAEPYLFLLEFYEAFCRQIRARRRLVASGFTEAHGRFSVFDDPEAVRQAPAHWPAGTRKAVIPDCGHMIHQERPELLAKEILDFYFAKE
jgi:pimeloyl-ACP methyl ester carboxylesterase